jgi:hypothetical protein
LFLGFESWLDPWKWPGYLLPVTLIAFLAVFLTILYRLLYRKISKRRPSSSKFRGIVPSAMKVKERVEDY